MKFVAQTKAEEMLMTVYPYNMIADLEIDPRIVNPIWFMQTVDEMLTERETEVAHLRYLDGYTYKQIGEAIGLSGARAQQILAKVKRKMRNPYRADNYMVVSKYEYEAIDKALTMTQEQLKWANDVITKSKYGNLPITPENDISLEELDLSVRAYNCLHRRGFEKLSDFFGVTQAELAGVRNLGRKCLNEIVEKLKTYGIDIPVGGVEV